MRNRPSLLKTYEKKKPKTICECVNCSSAGIQCKLCADRNDFWTWCEKEKWWIDGRISCSGLCGLRHIEHPDFARASRINPEVNSSDKVTHIEIEGDSSVSQFRGFSPSRCFACKFLISNLKRPKFETLIPRGILHKPHKFRRNPMRESRLRGDKVCKFRDFLW